MVNEETTSLFVAKHVDAVRDVHARGLAIATANILTRPMMCHRISLNDSSFLRPMFRVMLRYHGER